MYLRLVITRRDEESARKQGVFTPAYALLRGGTLPEAEHERLADVVDWFERHLPPPDRSRLEPRTIFWFRPGSDRLIRKIWEIVDILRRNGFHVELLKTSRRAISATRIRIRSPPRRSGTVGSTDPGGRSAPFEGPGPFAEAVGRRGLGRCRA